MNHTTPWPPELTTERLRLRPVAREDAEPMALLADDLDIARMTTSIPHPFHLQDAEGFIARMAACDRQREALFALELPSAGLIGLLGFHPTEGDVVELGYWLGRPYWDRGYMTEAVCAALDWARDAWSRAWLVSGHFDDNSASGAVLCKAGFLYTGERRMRFSAARGLAVVTRMMVWLA